MTTFIYTVTRHCSKITRVMLESFYRHHPGRAIYVFGVKQDFDELGEEGRHHQCIRMDISRHTDLLQRFRQGHSGTTCLFAMVIKKMFEGALRSCDAFIQVDSDMYFKRESLSLIEQPFNDGFDIVGTRRCYKNNPSGIPHLDAWPDTISTFFFGMKFGKIPDYPFDKMVQYCAGGAHPLGWTVLDCFDGVTHGAMQNGGRIHYLDWNQAGSQNEQGKKTNRFKSNMHMDVGTHMMHFGGVGSGYAYHSGHTRPEEGYGKWAVGRYSLFARIFYNEDIGYREPTKYTPDWRWSNGNYDADILRTVREEMLITD